MITSFWLAIVLTSSPVTIQILGDYETLTKCKDAAKEVVTDKKTICVPILHESI